VSAPPTLAGHAPERSRRFFEREARAVALDLVGCVLLVRGDDGAWCGGAIVETEAYLAERDPGSHARNGPTRRNASMFARGGLAYVYRIYGMHHCFNAVTGPAGRGEAVLVRALEPLVGLERMRARRGRERDLCNGPARLVEALGIAPEHDGADLFAAPFALLRPRRTVPPHRVVVDRRIGLGKGAELALRFRLRDSAFVSR